MPAISMFYGIIIYLYYFDNKQHHLPHIHAKYQSEEAIISIPDGNILEGSIPLNKMKLVEQHGLKYIKKNLWLTGIWPQKENKFLK